MGLSWSPERLRSLGSALHVCAWSVPAAQTVAALVRRDVDSDELTGKCRPRIALLTDRARLVFARILALPR